MIFWKENIRSIQLFISMDLSYNNLNKEIITLEVSDNFMYVQFILYVDIIWTTYHLSTEAISTQEYPDCAYGYVNILLIQIIL